MRTLKDVKIGETVRVTKVGGEGAIKRRIMELYGLQFVDDGICCHMLFSVRQNFTISF